MFTFDKVVTLAEYEQIVRELRGGVVKTTQGITSIIAQDGWKYSFKVVEDKTSVSSDDVPNPVYVGVVEYPDNRLQANWPGGNVIIKNVLASSETTFTCSGEDETSYDVIYNNEKRTLTIHTGSAGVYTITAKKGSIERKIKLYLNYIRSTVTSYVIVDESSYNQFLDPEFKEVLTFNSIKEQLPALGIQFLDINDYREVDVFISNVKYIPTDLQEVKPASVETITSDETVTEVNEEDEEEVESKFRVIGNKKLRYSLTKDTRVLLFSLNDLGLTVEEANKTFVTYKDAEFDEDKDVFIGNQGIVSDIRSYSEILPADYRNDNAYEEGEPKLAVIFKSYISGSDIDEETVEETILGKKVKMTFNKVVNLNKTAFGEGAKLVDNNKSVIFEVKNEVLLLGINTALGIRDSYNGLEAFITTNFTEPQDEEDEEDTTHRIDVVGEDGNNITASGPFSLDLIPHNVVDWYFESDNFTAGATDNPLQVVPNEGLESGEYNAAIVGTANDEEVCRTNITIVYTKPEDPTEPVFNVRTTSLDPTVVQGKDCSLYFYVESSNTTPVEVTIQDETDEENGFVFDDTQEEIGFTIENGKLMITSQGDDVPVYVKCGDSALEGDHSVVFSTIINDIEKTCTLIIPVAAKQPEGSE